MTKRIEWSADGKMEQTLDRGASMECRDCIFWYRCKLGGIDCELKGR